MVACCLGHYSGFTEPVGHVQSDSNKSAGQSSAGIPAHCHSHYGHPILHWWSSLEPALTWLCASLLRNPSSLILYLLKFDYTIAFLYSYDIWRHLFSLSLSDCTGVRCHCLCVFVVWTHWCYTNAVIINRPHHCTLYVVANWVVWSVCLSVSLFVCHTSQPCKNGRTNGDTIWVEDSGEPRELCIRWDPDPFMGRGNFNGGKGHRIARYRVTLQSSLQTVQRRLNWSKCHLGCGLGWAQGIMC